MRQRLLEARRKESGFTLIELLIVIVILGVLAGVVVLAVGAFDERGEEAACKSDVKAVEVAVEAFRAKTGAYPEDLEALVPDYLRQLPPQQEIQFDGANATGNGANAAYYVTYWAESGPAVGSYPARNAGAVWGDINGGAVSHNCSA